MLALAVATHSWWLAALGRMLVRDEGPAPAEIAVVLAGDYLWPSHRARRGARQAGIRAQRPGQRPERCSTASDECDLEIPFAMKNGYPQSWFIRAPNQARSTREEAAAILPELRRRGVHRFLLVTSDYHTARAARIYRAAAPRSRYPGGGRARRILPRRRLVAQSGRPKMLSVEWLKTVAKSLGM